MRKTRILRIKAIVLIFYSATFCSSSFEREIPEFQIIELGTYGIILELPDGWSLKFDQNQFFQFQAITSYEGAPIAFIEYRGLITDPKGIEDRDLYAVGWYKAAERNFPDWQYSSKEKLAEDGTLYSFEGTFKDGEITYRKIGKLSFSGKRIHAIYYTTREDLFDEFESEFETIDESIRFLDP